MAKFGLDGAMIPRTVKRMFDERSETRAAALQPSASLTIRGREHIVRLFNISPSGAMVACPIVPHIGEEVGVRLSGHDAVDGRVCWVRDGKIGINFLSPLE